MDKDIFKQVGNNISQVLTQQGKTQQALANEIGVSKQVMNKIVSGTKAINVAEISKIAKALDVPVDSLIFASDNNVKYTFQSSERGYVKEDPIKYTAGKSGSIIREKLPLPIGVSNYKRAVTEYYCIDKSLLIRDLIDENSVITLFTRPRRFGKTLNMDMVRTFFEISDGDTSVYFEDKNIWTCGEKYREYQGKYPVIFLTFKDVKQLSWENTFEMLSSLIISEYRRHPELSTSDKIADKNFYENIAKGDVSLTTAERSLQMLSKMLHEHHGVAPIIIIDEYDIPIQQGYMRGFYDESVSFMRNFFSGAFKDNEHLSYGFLTGILRVAKESIFSGLNNLAVNSVLDDSYSQYFGFTCEEVRKMAEYYGAADKMDEIIKWYDGYRFGNKDMFNPWSVINYFNKGCKPQHYWLSTSSNDIIGEVISEANNELCDELTSLINGNSVTTDIDTGIIYPHIKSDPHSIYSFLLVTGYLKVVNAEDDGWGGTVYEVALPNWEISYVYNKEIVRKLSQLIPPRSSISMWKALSTGNNEDLKAVIQKILLQSASYYDTIGEDFYHGLVLGLCALTGNYYTTSNRESGNGRYDIQLMPAKKNIPGILFELKTEKDCSDDKLKGIAYQALQQIKEKGYVADMEQKGISEIIKYGVAFSGKNVEIAVE